MQLSNYAIEKMGFRPLPDGESISGKFYALHVFRVQGLTFEAKALAPQCGMVEGTSVSLSMGSSVNAICQKLAGDEFVDDEEKWAKAREARPPYLAIRLGPTKTYFGKNVRFQVADDGNIQTYDSFQNAKRDLESRKEHTFPPLISSILCSIGSPDYHVQIAPVDLAVYGVTEDGRKIQDFRLTGSFSVQVDRNIEQDEVQASLSNSIKLAMLLNPNSAKFYYLAANENDPLKKFLYLFLSIEIESNDTFSRINHSNGLSEIISAPSRASKSAMYLFGRQRSNWRALRDRFIWCVLCVWTHMSDSDIELFGRLKGVRDGIAHGSISVPPPDAVRGAEQLALKLQKTHEAEL